jgi:hypothetical protein
MQGEQLLQDPDFAQTLAKSPFKAKDLPGLSTAVSDTFQKMTTEQKASLKEAIDQLERLPVQQLEAFLRLMDYVDKNPDQYPKLVEQLESSGAFDKGELPARYNPSLISVVKTLVGQALIKVKGSQPTQGYSKGGIASLKGAADDVKSAGRNGDTMLAHINPFEAAMLKRMGGSGTTNPETGLPEFGFFSSTFGQILKIGASIVATAVLTPFVGPIAAGAIVGGVSGLLSGQKPADALKSALIGGAIAGVSAGFSGSGSFTENAFAGGSLFGSAPAASPLLDSIKETTAGSAIFGDIPTATNVAGGAVEPGASANAIDAMSPQNTVTADNIPMPPTKPTDLLSPTTSAPASAASAPTDTIGKITSFAKDYKWPLLLGGGAALIAASQAEKKNDVVKPSLLNNVNSNNPNAGIISPLDVGGVKRAASPSSVFPGGQYIETPIFPKGGYTSPAQGSQPQQPQQFTGYDYTKIRFPTFGTPGVPTSSYGQEGIPAAVGGAIDGPGTGTSDSIPAKLSDGEFVMTAKAVRGAGNGDRAKGAKKMYGIMHKFERMA